MALSGSLNTNAYDGRYYQIRWTATQSIANNSSTINWTVSALGGGTRWFAERTLKVVIAGKTVINKEDRVERYDGEVASGSFTIAHAADGTKTIPVSIQAAVYTSTINCVASTTYTLDQIPKQAIITGASNFTDEDALTVTYRNSAGNAVTSLDMAISWTGSPDIAYRSVSKTGTSYTFNFTSAEQIKLQDAVTGSNSKIVTIYLRTVINGTTYYSTIQKTLSIANAEPYVNPTLTEQNSGIAQATGSSDIMIIGQSKIYCVSNATARKRASIVSVKIKNGTRVINAASGTFNNAESQNFIFEVTDSRGFTVTKTITRQAVNYFPPTVNASFKEFRTNGTAYIDVSGLYFNQYFSPEYANTLFITYRVAEIGGSYGSSVNVTKTLSGNSYTANFTIPNLDYTKSYKVEIQASDRFNDIYAAEIRFTGRPIFEWGKNDFKFNVPVTFAAGATGADIPTGGGSTSGGTDLSSGGTIGGDLTVTGNLRLKGSGNYGNKLYFGDGSYAMVSEDTDDALTIKANTINLNGTVKVNGQDLGTGGGPAVENGTWTPGLYPGVSGAWNAQNGWYQKVGNVVTVGFYIKYTPFHGQDYTDKVFSITGLPYTPRYSTGGSGTCSGAYISAGFNFMSYVAETSGKITTRVQACNNTSASNLSTSASGCFYSAGGAEMTLSGTICYLV